MSHIKQQLEQFYAKEDPWGFKTNSDDLKRKNIIIQKSKLYCKQKLGQEIYQNALELGAGEGWITKDLPAKNVYGYEISDLARSRWPTNVKQFDPSIKYDLIIAPGVLYKQYDYTTFLNMIRKYSSGIVMTISIKDWEINNLKNQIFEMEFAYRQYTEKLRIFNAKDDAL